MRDVPTPDPPVEDLGPKMLALTAQQRRFVAGWIKSRGKNQTRVARAAGYSDKGGGAKVWGSRLVRNPKIIEALKEEADRHLDGIAVLAILGLGDLIGSKNEKIKAAAIDSALDRTGYGRQSRQDIRVEHIDTRTNEELLRIIGQFAPKLIEKPIEGEFREVADGEKTA